MIIDAGERFCMKFPDDLGVSCAEGTTMTDGKAGQRLRVIKEARGFRHNTDMARALEIGNTTALANGSTESPSLAIRAIK